jgi:hypothetical protein
MACSFGSKWRIGAAGEARSRIAAAERSESLIFRNVLVEIGSSARWMQVDQDAANIRDSKADELYKSIVK